MSINCKHPAHTKVLVLGSIYQDFYTFYRASVPIPQTTLDEAVVKIWCSKCDKNIYHKLGDVIIDKNENGKRHVTAELITFGQEVPSHWCTTIKRIDQKIVNGKFLHWAKKDLLN